ncbi:peptidase M15 family protein, partial [Campylobacter coli]|nr:peptidase M15 family protein [Campylobacter coli]
VLNTYGERSLGIAIKHNFNDPYAGFVHLDTRGKKARWTYP